VGGFLERDPRKRLSCDELAAAILSLEDEAEDERPNCLFDPLVRTLGR